MRRTRPSKEQVRAKVAEMRARARRRRGEPKKRRSRWWLWLLLILLLLLLARLCCCAEAPVEPPEAPAVSVEVEPGGPPAPPPPAPEPNPKIHKLDRPTYANPAPEVLPWVAAFRLQVAARSLRLAQCFVGAPRPGALKWTASVDPGSGRVSDHVLEPALSSDALTSEQKTCVIGVLSDPPYKLEGGMDRSTPPRVSVAIEF
jgi:hypothetical protein